MTLTSLPARRALSSAKRLSASCLRKEQLRSTFLIRAESKKKVDKALAFWGDDAAKRASRWWAILPSPSSGVHPK